jgi:hypothetical protein
MLTVEGGFSAGLMLKRLSGSESGEEEPI